MTLVALQEWLHLAMRWFHVVAAIAWIGQTYLFHWMERTLTPPEDGDPNVAGRLWMVHGGGFYLVEKQKQPVLMPRTLHWFKWEAAFTWLSGVALLVVTYYAGGLLAYGPVELSPWIAGAAGLAVLVVGWLVYDALCRSPLGDHLPAFAAVGFGLILAASYGLHQLFNGRSAYIHVGALFGTIMVANVWLRILPGQSRMLAAVKDGREPDMSHGAQGKRRSTHNSYLSVPLVLIMVSNHFPIQTYGHRYHWLMLGAVVLVGWIAAKVAFFRTRASTKSTV